MWSAVLLLHEQARGTKPSNMMMWSLGCRDKQGDRSAPTLHIPCQPGATVMLVLTRSWGPDNQYAYCSARCKLTCCQAASAHLCPLQCACTGCHSGSTSCQHTCRQQSMHVHSGTIWKN